jgi:hypothetical protein
LIPLTVPEVRRLLRLLMLPAGQHTFYLHWSRWRRLHQASARRCHSAARARARPLPPARDGAAPALSPVPPVCLNERRLTNAEWHRVQPLLPPQAPTGRPPHDARTVLMGVLWVLRTNAGWRDLPAEFGPWRTVYGRYRQWCRTGLWPRLLRALETSPHASEVSL